MNDPAHIVAHQQIFKIHALLLEGELVGYGLQILFLGEKALGKCALQVHISLEVQITGCRVHQEMIQGQQPLFKAAGQRDPVNRVAGQVPATIVQPEIRLGIVRCALCGQVKVRLSGQFRFQMKILLDGGKRDSEVQAEIQHRLFREEIGHVPGECEKGHIGVNLQVQGVEPALFKPCLQVQFLNFRVDLGTFHASVPDLEKQIQRLIPQIPV